MCKKASGGALPRQLSFVLLMPPNRTVQVAGATPVVDELDHFTLALKSPFGGVIVSYRSMPGNRPQSNGNSVALWDSTIPNLQSPPLAAAPVPTNLEVGDVYIPYQLQQSNYSVTYQTDGYSTMNALAPVRLAPNAFEIPTFVSLTISSLDTSGVKVIYSTLPGYTPATYKNWVGLWRGFASPYSAGSPMGRVPITEDYSQGEATIPFSPGPFDYTLIYFLGEKQLTAGALLYFQVSAPTAAKGENGTLKPR